MTEYSQNSMLMVDRLELLDNAINKQLETIEMGRVRVVRGKELICRTNGNPEK